MALKPLTNYPNGFSGGVNILGMPILNTYGGKVYWVNSAAGTNDNRGTRDRPLPTIDTATTLCTANNGDIVMIMENHAETITGAGGIAFDKAGVTYVGLGTYNQRPRFLMDGGTTVTATVTAADVKIENMVFAGGNNTIAACFDITASGFSANGIEFEDNTTNEHFLVCFRAAGTTDEEVSNMSITGCRYVTVDSGVTDFISLAADVTNLTVSDNYYCADAATGAGLILCATGKDIRGLQMFRNTMVCGNTTTDMLIDNDQNANTGIAAYNLLGHHDTASVITIDCDGIRQFQNYATADDLQSGVLLPVVDDDA